MDPKMTTENNVSFASIIATLKNFVAIADKSSPAVAALVADAEATIKTLEPSLNKFLVGLANEAVTKIPGGTLFEGLLDNILSNALVNIEAAIDPLAAHIAQQDANSPQ
jgi:hypothetical protein